MVTLITIDFTIVTALDSDSSFSMANISRKKAIWLTVKIHCSGSSMFDCFRFEYRKKNEYYGFAQRT